MKNFSACQDPAKLHCLIIENKEFLDDYAAQEFVPLVH